MRRILLPATFALALCLAGCAAPEPPEPGPLTDSSPQPSTPAPRELSDEEALTIAVETYETYMAATIRVLDAGFDENGYLSSLTAEPMREALNEGLELAASQDWTASGSVATSNPVLVSRTTDSDRQRIEAALCADTAMISVKDEHGIPTRDESDPTRSTVLIVIESSAEGFKLAGLSGDPSRQLCEQ